LRISFDPAKRELTRRHRGLDFARAGGIFEGRIATIGSITARRVSSARGISTAGWW
jgi:hypothetical protein